MQSVTAILPGGKRQTVDVGASTASQGTTDLRLRCPECSASIGGMAYPALAQEHEPLACRECFATFAQEQGIWLALRGSRRPYFERFIREYETVRKMEGRGSEDPAFYLSLPYCDRTNRNSWQWTIRARTYKYIERNVLPAANGKQLTILDLGAGNGWLSYRLASLGHRPIAVDLLTNAFDGLGAAVHYRLALATVFPRFQAEFDRLPFETGQFDCAVFNASFHYSVNYDSTLSEAIRCLRPGGTVVIADTPSYKREESGCQMVAERRLFFQRRFGFASDSLASCEYITKDRLLALGAGHHLEWITHDVWYGFGWACRPLLARIRGRREPSQFRIYTAQVKIA